MRPIRRPRARSGEAEATRDVTGARRKLRRTLRAAYDAKLSRHDLLLIATLPMTATPLPPADAPRELYIQRALEMIANTAPFDANGHPAERSRHQRDLHLFAPRAPGA